MDSDEYEKMAAVEDRMWWYRGLHANLAFAVHRFLPRGPARLLDAGCGTGGLLRALEPALDGCRLFGLDVSGHACTAASARSRRPIVRGGFHQLPFADGSVDCVVSTDVLCHENVDPPRALREARRCLRPGGVLVVSLPAYDWLLSYHDARVRNVRRFTRRRVEGLLEDAGLAPVYATYWNTLLLPVMAIRRLLVGPRENDSDVHPYPRPLDAILGSLLTCERALLRIGTRLPFGGSVLAVAAKRDG